MNNISNRQPLDRREFMKRATQAAVTMVVSAGMVSTATPLAVRAGEVARGSRASYYCNGEIHVNELGKPEGKPLTTGHWDFKPSWSKTGEHARLLSPIEG